MGALSRRTQVLLSADQYRRVERLASRRGQSVGAVIRAAVDAYMAPPRPPRRAALELLVSLDAPTADWETMKAEILEGAGR